MGGAVKWSINEAVKALPVDFSTRFNILHTVNPKHLDFSTLGLDLIMGKPFGLLGMFNLAPYMAYRPLWIIPHSVTVDSVPNINTNVDNTMMTGMGATPDTNAMAGPLVFPSKDQASNFPIMLNRFTFGIRFLVGAFKFTPEFTMAPDTQGTHTSFAVNLGLNL